ncbi:MAG: hypothetical protein EOO73_19550 [Myxococcales bacterium]|nr:MAG: hypothetical protein EOO73_19550 [Myxococcales bacterium]
MASVAAMILTVWYEKVFPAIPELRRMRHETANRILVATAAYASAAAIAALPIILTGVGRWLGVCVQGLAVWGSALLVAIGGDWTRRLALVLLLPWACVAFLRGLTGPGSPLPARVAQGCSIALGGAFSTLLFVAIEDRENAAYAAEVPLATPGRLTIWLVLVCALLLLWSPPLFFQGRAPSEILRLGPVDRARDQTLGIAKWLGLFGICAGGGLLNRAILLENAFESWVPFGATLLFALPLALRGGRRGLGVAFALALFVAIGAAVKPAPAALAIFYWVVLAFSIPVVLMGRVEWRQRLLRVLGLLGGIAALAAVAMVTKDETIAIVLGPALCWSGVFVVDYIKLRDRAAEREAAAHHSAYWSPKFTRLVSTSRVEVVALSLITLAFAIPFVYAGSGIGRQRPCWRDRYPTPRPMGCGASPRPELILDRATKLVISEKVTAPDVQGALFDELATGGDHNGLIQLQYLNQLSMLEELEPCYQLGWRVSVNQACAGYRIHDVATEAAVLNNLSMPAETRIARKLTADETSTLAGNPLAGGVNQEIRKR